MNGDRKQDGAGGRLSQLIGFRVGREEYGIDILRVREIIRVRTITRLPGSPEFMKGVINLRGDVIPIIDLRERFGLEAQGDTEHTRVVVVEVKGAHIGLVVDSTSQVVRVPEERIDPPPPFTGGLSTEYVRGIGRLEDRLMILLDIDRILSAGEAALLQGVERREVVIS